MDNSTILNNIVHPQEQAVFKGMYSDMETGKAVLNPEQLGQFLRYAQINNTILSMADFKLMKSFKKELTRVGIDGRVLQSGYTKEGATNPDLVPADVSFGVNELDAKKLKATCQIEDDEKEDNLEQKQFEQTLLSMMGERIGEDLEFWALFADTTIQYDTNNLLSTTDGWIKTATNQLQSAGQKTAVSSGNEDFNLEEDTVESMFDAMIYKLPLRFRQQRNNLVFFVPYEVEDAYRNLLKSRGTNLGDTTQTGFGNLAYKGIPITYCPTLDAEDGRDIDDTATSILTNPKNLAWGVWKNLSIEPERIPKNETTKYWYRIRGDVDMYFREAAVVAKMTTEEAAALPLETKV